MSETAKKVPIINNDESYSPKTQPKLIKKVLEGKEADIMKDVYPTVKTIEEILDMGDPEIWGSYACRFAQLYKYLEKDLILSIGDTGRLFLSVTAMGLISYWNQSDLFFTHPYRLTHNYIERSMNFSGYGYKTIFKNNDENNKTILMNEIIKSINNNIPVLACYDTSDGFEWQLVIGYDINKDTLEYKKTYYDYKGYWNENLKYIIIITETGLSKSSPETIFFDIVKTMETTDFDGAPVGIAAYKSCIDFLSNDQYFDTVDDDTLQKNHRALCGTFAESQAEQGGRNGEGFYVLSSFYEDKDLKELLYRLHANGYVHHQLSRSIQSSVNSYPEEKTDKKFDILRNKAYRTTVIYIINQLIDNHAYTLNEIKKYLKLNTPDIYTLGYTDTKISAEWKIPWSGAPGVFNPVINPVKNIQDLSKKYSIKSTEEYSFEKAELMINSKYIPGWRGGGMDDWGYFATSQVYRTPVKIDVTAKSNGPAIRLYMGNGCVVIEKNGDRNILWISDPITGFNIEYYPTNLSVFANEYVDISWILHNDFMAVVVNGEIIHYGENYPYMKLTKESFTVRIGTKEKYNITINSLDISCLE